MKTTKLLKDLIKEVKQSGLTEASEITNYFYRNYIDENKFKDFNEFNFLLLSDRCENEKDIESKIKNLVKNRKEFLHENIINYYTK